MANTEKVSFITLDEVKDALNITDTNSDSILGSLISAQSAAIQSATNRKLIKTTYTDYFNGDHDLKQLCLQEFPVSSITTVHDDTDRDYDAGSLISSEDYVVEADTGILRFDTLLTRGQQNIKVVYVAGYDPVPDDLKLACTYLVAAEYKALRMQVNTREGMQVLTAQLDKLREQAMALIHPYKRMPDNG